MLLMMTILVMIVSAVLLEGLAQNRSHARTLQNDANKLGLAREALVAFSRVHSRGVGVLPCPDMDFSGDGRADSPCPAKGDHAVGWLPWRDLGLPPWRVGQGTHLWYVVATGFLPSRPEGGGTQHVRALHLEGMQGMKRRAAAVVMVPGEGLSKQRGNTDVVLSAAAWHDAHLISVARVDVFVTPEGRK